MSKAYVGCRTTETRHARGKGIKVFDIDEKTGDWREIQCLKTEENPSYLAMDNTENYLYSVHGDFTCVSSYRIEKVILCQEKVQIKNDFFPSCQHT